MTYDICSEDGWGKPKGRGGKQLLHPEYPAAGLGASGRKIYGRKEHFTISIFVPLYQNNMLTLQTVSHFDGEKKITTTTKPSCKRFR